MIKRKKEVQMERKGQAAVEFLMTYGWAILAAIVVIGAIAIYFRPDSAIQDSLILTPPFFAQAITVSNNLVTTDLRNNGAETVNITSIAIANVQGATNPCTTLLPDLIIIAGGSNSTATAVTCAGMATAGSRFSGDVTITYLKSGTSLVSRSTGRITAKIA